jgi:hypothetical protein
MLKHWAFLFPTALLLSDASAKVLPVMDLPIVNKEIAPDGIKRSATLAGGVFPGPLITANKVSASGWRLTTAEPHITRSSTSANRVTNYE